MLVGTQEFNLASGATPSRLDQPSCDSFAASDPHLDFGRAPYVLYGVKCIDLVSLALFAGQ